MTSPRTGLRRWLHEHGLLLVNLALFLVFLGGMAVAGWDVASREALDHGDTPDGFGSYLASGEFVEAVFENWESEFLQMGAYVVLTIFLFQKGSSESKPLDGSAPADEDPRRRRKDPKAPWPVRHGGFVLVLYENSMLILFALLFAASFLLHLFGGAAAFSEEQTRHGSAARASRSPSPRRTRRRARRRASAASRGAPRSCGSPARGSPAAASPRRSGPWP